ncbi:MAG: tetratricopeptide repeat protein [Elusimicrobia bacterium]|nr:tetratricopeptide repeat protein [Candidatus Obscuribacterium magneticum]MCB4755482.1 tetratricopeptide repeat protein [Candidatus Obscuribacterium magneticum]
MSVKAELKENILATKVEGVVKWGIDHRPLVLMAAVALLASVLISSVFILRAKERRDLNWTRLAQAQSYLAQKQFATAQSILEEIQKTAPNTTEALHAAYTLGLVSLETKNDAAAINAFSTVANLPGNHPLRPLALSNLGYAYEQKKDHRLAAQTLQRFIDQYADHFLAARTQLSVGRNWALAGDKEAATKALTQLIDLYPTSEWAKNARVIMDKIKTR